MVSPGFDFAWSISPGRFRLVGFARSVSLRSSSPRSVLLVDAKEIDFKDFVRGFHALTEPVTGKALLEMDLDMRSRWSRTEYGIFEARVRMRFLNKGAAVNHRTLSPTV